MVDNSSPINLRQWRLQILQKDNYICQLCGLQNRQKLLAHHIKDKKLFPTLIYDINNGITLCTRCHKTQPLQRNLFKTCSGKWIIPKRSKGPLSPKVAPNTDNYSTVKAYNNNHLSGAAIVRVYESGHAFLGRDIIEEGYLGNVDAVGNAVTITLVKPNTDLKSVIRSLEITIQDIRLRMSQEPKDKNGRENK